jgi:hypothetical protein
VATGMGDSYENKPEGPFSSLVVPEATGMGDSYKNRFSSSVVLVATSMGDCSENRLFSCPMVPVASGMEVCTKF